MNFCKTVFATLLLSLPFLNLQAQGKPKERPELQEVVVTEADSAEAFLTMYLAHDSGGNDTNAFDNVNLTGWEIQQMRDFANGQGDYAEAQKGIPGSRRSIDLIRYRISDPKAYDALIDIAQNSGIKGLRLASDANEYLKFDYPPDAISRTDYNNAAWQNNDLGRGIQRLINEGRFQLVIPGAPASSPFLIFTQPVFNEEVVKIIDIMHEKEILLLTYNPDGTTDWSRSVGIHGTSNMTQDPRYNRILRTRDPRIVQFMAEHADLMMKAFQEGKAIKDIPSFRRLRVKYPKGFYQASFTDGKDNTNQDIVDELNDFAARPTKRKLHKVIHSHFAPSFGPIFKSLRAAMKAQTEAEMIGIYDKNFISVDGFGKVAPLAGYAQDGFENIPVTYPFGWELRKRMKLYAYMRPIPGQNETSLDGPPVHYIWHDKTTIHVWTDLETGEEWVDIFTGSFNLSSHEENAEHQAWIRLPAHSPLAKAFIQSIEDPIRKEKEWMVPLYQAVFRMAVSKFIGHSAFEIPMTSIRKITDEISEGQKASLVEVQAEILRLANQPTTIKEDVPMETIVKKLAQISDFIKWYQSIPEFKESKISVQDLVALTQVLASGVPEKDQNDLLESLLWAPSLDEKKIDFLIKEARLKMGLDPCEKKIENLGAMNEKKN